MAVRLINPIKSNPASAYVPLPTELMAKNLQDNQERFDYAEAGIRAFDDIFKSGYSSSDLEKALREEYDPQLQELSETFYSTGNVGYTTSAIAEMNKKVLADPRYRTALEDYQYKQMIDKQLQDNPLDVYNNAIYDEAGNITGWNPIKPGQSLGSHYGFTPYANFTDDVLKYGVNLLKASLDYEGISYDTNPDGSIRMTQDLVERISNDNRFTVQARNSLIRNMISNPEAYPGATYIKAKYPKNWQQIIKDTIETQWQQIFYEKHQEKPISDNTNRRNTPNAPNFDSTTISIPIQYNFTPEGPLGKLETFNNSQEVVSTTRRNAVNSTLQVIEATQSDPSNVDFKESLLNNAVDLLVQSGNNIPQETLDKLGPIFSMINSGQLIGQNLETAFRASQLTPDEIELFEELMIQASIATFENPKQGGVFREKYLNHFNSINQYTQAASDRDNLRRSYEELYTQDSNLGKIFRNNPELIPIFESKMKDGKLPEFEEFFDKRAILTYGEELNERGVPISLIEAFKNAGITEITLSGRGQEVRAKVGELSQDNIQNLVTIPTGWKSKGQRNFDSLKSYYEKQKRELEESFSKQQERQEIGISLIQGGQPSPSFKGLYAIANNNIEVNAKKQFPLYDEQSEKTPKLYDADLNSIIELRNIVITPSSIKDGKLVGVIDVFEPTPQGGKKKKEEKRILLDISKNNNTLQNVLEEAIASSIVNGTEDQLPQLYTLYGINQAKLSGAYTDLALSQANVDNEARPTYKSINIGGIEFSVKATGRKPNRNYNVTVGGVISGLETNESGLLTDPNQVWQFVGRILELKKRQALQQQRTNTPGGSGSPLAQGKSFIPQ